MTLRILTPQSEDILQNVSKVFLPGSEGRFEVLANHAPLLSSLVEGELGWCEEDGEASHTFRLGGGFVRVEDNVVTVVAQE